MRKNKQKGYAIMFTMILISIISLIGIGLSNTTYKQLMLSSGAKDSQIAFYESDMATECALYADNSPNVLNGNPIPSTFSCGIDKDNNPYTLSIISIDGGFGITTYSLSPSSSISNSSNPCFRITIKKDSSIPVLMTTKIQAMGYSICNMNKKRTVERTIEVNY